ncbi:SurA N-terminal domain-containing protein [Candidatus Spongiihabitans sp.]|uniref:SurA N-terminal domain-containing protein n=1 Tax=Candidatus Spongiihabitans sp. TaxID=3101308 RepID=UPI003C7B1D5C
MLTAIRERATGWIAWVIVTLITIPFALWGINSYFQGATEIAVATVNGAEISNYAYQQALSAQRQTLIDRLGGDFDPALLDSLGVKSRVIDSLVDDQLLTQFTIDQNFRISDDQLKEIIQTFPAFLEQGRFSQTRYLELLNANRLTAQGFEQSQRQNGAINQLRAGIADSAFFTAMERDQLLALSAQSRSAQYTVLNADKFDGEFDIDDAEIQAYYEKNLGRYETESSIKVDYIELSVESLSGSIAPSEQEINALYEDTKGRYKQAESRTASHILVSVSESDNEEQKRAKFELARDILNRANAGEDFAALAQQYSDDPGSKQNGGDLGVVARGQMVKPFEDAVFAMRAGEIQGPIETRFGYHIIKLTALSAERQQTLDQVRDEVLQDLMKFQAENLFAELAESFKNLVFEDPDDLTTAADAMDLPIQSSDWFTANKGGGVAEDAAVRRAAFAEDVLNENLVSSAIEIGFDKLVAVQKSEYEAAHPKSLESVRSEIIATIKSEKSQAKVWQMGSDLLTSLESSVQNKASWERFIAQQNLRALTLPSKKSEIPAELTMLGDVVFALSAPKKGEVRFGGLALDNGDYALVSLEQVEQSDLASVDDAQRTTVQQQLLERDGAGMFNRFRALLRKNADITISQQQL